MSDLPTRLRELAEALTCCEWEVPLCASDDCVRAADEIERLTLENERLKNPVAYVEFVNANNVLVRKRVARTGGDDE